ncbi:glycosyltransferase [bacterium]|nr:glycosyltransferase [bacterium]
MQDSIPPQDELLKEDGEPEFNVACLSHLCWDRKLFQRPQQVMSRIAKRHPVEYFCQVPTKSFWSLPRTSTLCYTFSPRENVRINYLPFMPLTGKGYAFRAINRGLYTRKAASMIRASRKRPLVLWLYHPKDVAVLDRVSADLVVYDCMDEFQAFMNSEPETREYERRVLTRADIVFAGGHSLYDAKKEFNPNTHLFPCGVEFEHFAKATAAETEVAEEMSGIKRPIIGYVGAVDERLDYDLLIACAKSRPDWSFVLIGPLLKVNPERLFAMPNVHHLGAKPYSDLASYLKAFDVATMPFALTELTSKISPTKTLEYFSSSLPVVSSRVPDVVAEYSDLVEFYEDLPSFERAIEKCLELSAEDRLKFREAAKGKSWDQMVSSMARLIQDELGRRG